MDIIGIRSCA